MLTTRYILMNVMIYQPNEQSPFILTQ